MAGTQHRGRGRGRRRARHDAAEMRRLLRRKQREGLTYGQLSERSGVPSSTLQWWKRRLAQSGDSVAVAEEKEPSVRFVEAAVLAAGPSGARYEVVLANGRRLVLEEGFRRESVRDLLGILDGPC